MLRCRPTRQEAPREETLRDFSDGRRRSHDHLLGHLAVRIVAPAYTCGTVPDEVITRLERLAAREKLSVSALAVRELAEASRRVDNPTLLNALPDLNIESEVLTGDVEAEHADR